MTATHAFSWTQYLAMARARQRHTCPDPGRTIRIVDGARVVIRPIASTDAGLLLDGFARLSATSRWSRFLTAKHNLSAAEVRYLTDVDHRDHEALIATDYPNRRAIGVARFIRSALDPRAAELAITIVDDWQSRGLGTQLLSSLIQRAQHEGVERLTALVATQNTAALQLLRGGGRDLHKLAHVDSANEYAIMLGPLAKR